MEQTGWQGLQILIIHVIRLDQYAMICNISLQSVIQTFINLQNHEGEWGQKVEIWP